MLYFIKHNGCNSTSTSTMLDSECGGVAAQAVCSLHQIGG
jgi:hypothetical protein